MREARGIRGNQEEVKSPGKFGRSRDRNRRNDRNKGKACAKKRGEVE